MSGQVAQKVASKGQAGVGSILDDIGRGITGLATGVNDTLYDTICSPAALTLLPSALSQRGADPQASRQRVVELQRSCGERYDREASERQAKLIM